MPGGKIDAEAQAQERVFRRIDVDQESLSAMAGIAHSRSRRSQTQRVIRSRSDCGSPGNAAQCCFVSAPPASASSPGLPE